MMGQDTKTPVGTHPWITFRLDAARFNWSTWLLAGEVVSKCEHVAGVPLLLETAQELMRVYLSKGAQATTAIEGNTLSAEEVRQRVEHRLVLPPSKEYLGVEVDNIVSACNDLLREAHTGDSKPLTPERIMGFNRTVLQNLELEEHVQPGKIRTYLVGVGDYRAVPHQDVPRLLDLLCRWLSEPWFPSLDTFRRRDLCRLEAVFKAVLAHLYIAWIHPFGDGNGRTARLVEFHILVNAGIPFPSAHLLSNHYNETRTEYYRQLSYASKSQGDVSRFVLYALRGFADQLREQIGVIREQQQKIFWENQVAAAFSESETGRRRKHLVLDLATAGRFVPRRTITDLSPFVARTYAKLDEKTLTRDLQVLEEKGLVESSGGSYRARTEIVLAYLPPAKDAGTEPS